MAVTIPSEEIRWFREVIDSDGYSYEERRYKEALHLAISSLLSAEMLDDPRFPETLASVLNGDVSQLPVAERINATLARSKEQDVARGLANLAGGKWGRAQSLWIPRAVQYGLGEELRYVFKDLVSKDPLTERVDRFRDRLYEVQVQLQERGGFDDNWRLLPTSLAFVAAFLGAYDPGRYTFYLYAALRQAYRDFGLEWPQGTAGARYQAICDFVSEVAEVLRSAGLPVRDLIDAQSFLFLRARAAPAPSEGARPRPLEAPDSEALAQELAAATYWPVERARRLIELVLVQGVRQLLFYGPPGTGKTYVARRLAELLTGEDEARVAVVQFHPSYSYEDFVEGIRPKVSDDVGSLRYEVRRGLLLDLVERAKERPEDLMVLLIDEINRANLPRVLGELLYALEYRGPKYPFRLPYSGREVYVPENLVVIGTMNSADRSIALVDAAVRRRFRHVRFEPEPHVLRDWLRHRGKGAVAELASRRLTELNHHLLSMLDADRLIGHSYLMRNELEPADFQRVWEEDIEPVLQEHLYHRPGELDRARRIFLATE